MIDNNPIKISFLSLTSNLFLAPMDGFTDHPFRMLVKKLGAGVVFSEFINGLDVVNHHPFLEKKIFFDDSERPFGYQIFDDSPERILIAAQFLQEKSPDFIDVNFGCSAKNVTNRGAGAGLLLEPGKVAKIISLLVKKINVPITAKIRLGWDEQKLNYMEISRIIEEEGASIISVHGRTKKQAYTGEADWNAIAEIKTQRKIPIIANGDVVNTKDLANIQQKTNCDGIMIGRGALTNPWIFQRRNLNEISVEEKFSLFTDHFSAILAFYGKSTGMTLFRKHLKSYLQIDQMKRTTRIELFNTKDESQFINLVKFYIENPNFN